ncbi:MAG: FecR domain-containing protein [Betaproteobacteria bacterium]|nr:FecR domain-containing protein [Betaproteobacteria bacterium]
MRSERRAWLRGATAAALAAQLGAQFAVLRAALAQDAIAKGVHGVKGRPLVNGRDVKPGMPVRAGDTVTTDAKGELVFVVGRDAMLLRRNSRIEVQGEKGALVAAGLRVLTGAILSVFAPGAGKRLQTPTATIGIRGTGIYVEAEKHRTYVCTCYGTAELAAAADPGAREVVTTRHHDEPRYIMAKGAPQMLMKAPVVNHTDAELTLLEALVGRKPPFLAQPGYQPGRYY